MCVLWTFVRKICKLYLITRSKPEQQTKRVSHWYKYKKNDFFFKHFKTAQTIIEMYSSLLVEKKKCYNWNNRCKLFLVSLIYWDMYCPVCGKARFCAALYAIKVSRAADVYITRVHVKGKWQKIQPYSVFALFWRWTCNAPGTLMYTKEL